MTQRKVKTQLIIIDLLPIIDQLATQKELYAIYSQIPLTEVISIILSHHPYLDNIDRIMELTKERVEINIDVSEDVYDEMLSDWFTEIARLLYREINKHMKNWLDVTHCEFVTWVDRSSILLKYEEGE